MLLDESTDELFHDLDVEEVDCDLVLADFELLVEDEIWFAVSGSGRQFFAWGFSETLGQRMALFDMISHQCRPPKGKYINPTFIKPFCSNPPHH